MPYLIAIASRYAHEGHTRLTFRTVGGQMARLVLADRFLVDHQHQPCVFVSVINRSREATLVQLPYPTEDGHHRLLVPTCDLVLSPRPGASVGDVDDLHREALRVLDDEIGALLELHQHDRRDRRIHAALLRVQAARGVLSVAIETLGPLLERERAALRVDAEQLCRELEEEAS